MPTTPMQGDSRNPQSDLFARLQKDFPEVFNEGKIDPTKLKSTLGEFIEPDEERYGLSWAGKSDCFRRIQETTTNTLKPVREDSVNFDNSQNLFIEGDNLEVLKVLQRSYHGKVKMIYIDPPYNTGHDFVYSDKFARSKREELIANGSLDEAGNVINHDLYRENTRDGGHFHSNWLNMIYPRLFLARNMLRHDGVIFVSIDDNEVANLRKIMDEIFGEENFVASVVWERAYSPINLKHHFSESHDYIVCYARNIDELENFGLKRSDNANDRYKNPDNDPRGPWKSSDFSVGPANQKNIYPIINPAGRACLPPSGYSWRFSEEKTKELIVDNRVSFGENGTNVPAYKRFLSEVKDGITPMTIWKYGDVGHSQDATKEVKDIFEGKAYFDYPKPIKLISRLLELCTGEDDIILDFFAGSGTTAHAVMALNAEDGGNRKWICVQLPEKCKPESEASKAGFATIAHISRERIRRAGKKIGESVANSSPHPVPPPKEEGVRTNQLDLGFKAFRLDASNFKVWNTQIENVEQLEQQMIDFVDNVRSDTTSENLIYELIIKSGYDLNVPLETKKTSDGDYHRIAGGELIICIADTLTRPIFDAIIADKPQKIITLDRSFAGNDQLKTNMVLMAEQEGVKEFKVI